MGLFSKLKCKFGLHDFQFDKVLSSQVVKVYCKSCKKYYIFKMKGEHQGSCMPWNEEVEEFYNMLYELAREKYSENPDGTRFVDDK